MANLLLVDDSKLTLSRMRRAFENNGHTISTACNGKEAFDELTNLSSGSSPYDIIVTDIHMPEMGGLELVEKLRAAGLEQPIIVCTADLQKTTRDSALEAGASEILNKPDLFDAKGVEKVLAKYLSCMSEDSNA